LLATGNDQQLARAEELYIGLAEEDPLDHRLWEALARLYGRRIDLWGLEATARRLRSALVELGEAKIREHAHAAGAGARIRGSAGLFAQPAGRLNAARRTRVAVSSRRYLPHSRITPMSGSDRASELVPPGASGTFAEMRDFLVRRP
jgi:hypothetical protein